jgi:hypothetical protein
MGALNYISYAVFAIIFIGIAFTVYAHYQQVSTEQDFLSRTGALADQIEDLALQDVGSSVNFSITVPSGCRLSFENNFVRAVVGSTTENFGTGNVTVSGQPLESGSFQLRLERSQEGVTISEA